MYRLIFILFGFLLAWPVAAEDLQNSLEACTALPDKAAQLACFDGLEAGPVAAPAAQDGLQDQLEFCLALANKRDQLACFDRVGASNPEPGVPDARAGAVPPSRARGIPARGRRAGRVGAASAARRRSF